MTTCKPIYSFLNSLQKCNLGLYTFLFYIFTSFILRVTMAYIRKIYHCTLFSCFIYLRLLCPWYLQRLCCQYFRLHHLHYPRFSSCSYYYSKSLLLAQVHLLPPTSSADKIPFSNSDKHETRPNRELFFWHRLLAEKQKSSTITRTNSQIHWFLPYRSWQSIWLNQKAISLVASALSKNYVDNNCVTTSMRGGGEVYRESHVLCLDQSLQNKITTLVAFHADF